MSDLKNDLKNVPYIKQFFGEYLDLRKDKDNEALIVESIRNGVEFKGTNLWILIFAIFIASLGLNVNSTAVIIGAMLISPLMGPIMGVGLAIGQNDFELLKRSLKSYLVATVFSVITSTIYFSLTPLDEVQSELLARTSPTIYDVLIALCGGLAGIIALSTKEKGNVIPGVAIATALMPPLCTAGFGLATGNLLYFLGAFYLYFINSVFISLATFIGVRVMHFQRKEFVDKEREKLVKKYIIFITLATMCPAVYLTYGIVKSTIYEASANNFINEELNFNNTQVIDRKISFEKKEIRVVLIGNEVSETEIATARDNLKLFNLAGTKLVVLQGMNNDAMDIGSIKAQMGIYDEKSLKGLPKEFVSKYFTQVSDRSYQISDQIKRCVKFCQHNLLKDRYPKECDLIVCRNVMIYFTEEAKKEIYQKFNASLKKDGLLFVGSTEQIISPGNIGFASFKSFFYKRL